MQVLPTEAPAPAPAASPRAQRQVTRTDRTTVTSAPEATLSRLADLPGTIGPDTGLRLEGWPTNGVADTATFRVAQDGGLIAYEIQPRHDATGLALRATGPQWTADHAVDVQGLPDGTSEVTWQLTLSSNVAVTEDVVAQASALSAATLRALRD